MANIENKLPQALIDSCAPEVTKTLIPLYIWQHDPPPPTDPAKASSENIRALCKEGVAAVRAGSVDGLLFEVFGEYERQLVLCYMKELGPDVPYRCRAHLPPRTEEFDHD